MDENLAMVSIRYGYSLHTWPIHIRYSRHTVEEDEVLWPNCKTSANGLLLVKLTISLTNDWKAQSSLNNDFPTSLVALITRLYGIYRPLKYSMLSNINHNSTEIFQENIIYLELIWNDICYLLIPASLTYLYPNFWRYSVSPCHTVSLIAYHRSVQHSFIEKSFISCEPASVPLWNFRYSVCHTH